MTPQRHTLVTGAAGFIGSHLCEGLLTEGHRVIGVDSFSDHYSREYKELNLANLMAEPMFSLMEIDVASEPIGEVFADIDIVFHLAARPGVRDSWVEFEDYVEANLVGSKAIFDAAVSTQTRVVYASSSSVYGNAPSLPVTEDHGLHPISPYGASKAMTEMLAAAYASSYGLDAIGLRYFTVYGPRQRPDMALSRFIAALVDEREISLYGDGLQRRDMTYVGDVVDATLAAAERGRAGAIYNVASNEPRPLLDVFGVLCDVLGLPPGFVQEEAKPGDVRDTWGDISLAATEIGYEPKMSLRDGLERQVEEALSRRAGLGVMSGAQAA